MTVSDCTSFENLSGAPISANHSVIGRLSSLTPSSVWASKV